jgi:hypothetical protein
MMKRAAEGKIESDRERKFDRFKEEFFMALKKLNRMQEIAELLEKD